MLLLLATAFANSGCRRGGPEPEARTWIEVYTQPLPKGEEPACAWFGDRRDDVVYFGQAAFWRAMREAGGDPTAELARSSPQRIGRFDLAGERFLPSLDVTEPPSLSGVWDVLAHPNGRVYFTTYYERAGWIDPESGARRRLGPETIGLNELALGPDDTVLATRYGSADGSRPGGVVQLDAEGDTIAEWPLPVAPGLTLAPKSLAFDARRREIWITTDLLGESVPSGAAGHPSFILGLDGVVRLRWDRDEIQFVQMDGDGRGRFAVVDAQGLWLGLVDSEAVHPTPAGAERVLLDADFQRAFDFV